MITCTNCGTTNPETARNCQNCMAPLPAPVGRGEGGLGTRVNTQDQQLPAWLESLRAGDRPAAIPKNFSPEDMSEEGMVPSWMQPNRPNDERGSSPYPSMRSAASSAPNTDENDAPERNISANSLIDPNALPSWMQQEKPQQPQQNIAASSLIQPEFMPEWMKTMQPSSQAQPSTPMPQQKPPTQPSLPVQGFSAQQLIDQQALPNWMQQEGGQNFTPPAQSAGQVPYTQQAGNSSTGQAGFAANSLIDPNALPSWMREGERGRQEQRGPQPQQSTWQAPQQPAYPSAPEGVVPTQGQAGTLSMGSLIDMNVFPEWLRSAAAEQQSQQGQQGPANTPQRYTGPNAVNSYGTPSRVDNMRVPSRPRGEVGTNEGSEVAANVFASMLGVASNAPQFPAQQQQQGYPAYPSQQPMGNMMPPTQAGQGQGIPNAQSYASGQLGQQNYGQYAQPGYGNGMQQPGQGNYPGGPMGQQRNQGMAQMSAQGEKPAKKGGLFEAIRNFFFRQ